MRYPATIRRQNDLIRRELGEVAPGLPWYQWVWSEDLTVPMVILDSTTGKPILDYVCGCGRNLSVHKPNCNWTKVEQRWERRKIAPDYHDQWIFCCRILPEASRDDWASCFGSEPYPEQGYLVPTGDPAKCIALAPGQTPLMGTTEYIIRHTKEFLSTTTDEKDRETRERWEQRDAKKQAELELRCKDAFPVHSGWPGENQDWSAGGVGEPPVLRKFTEGDNSGTTDQSGT